MQEYAIVNVNQASQAPRILRIYPLLRNLRATSSTYGRGGSESGGAGRNNGGSQPCEDEEPKESSSEG